MLWPSRVLFGIVAVVFALEFQVPGWLEYAPFVASLVFLGLPHGALDHLVPDRLSGRETTARSVAAVMLLYLALGGLYLTLWTTAPVAACGLFIALTWLHWGQGDLHAQVLLEARPKTRLSRAATVFVRGGLPMLVPLLAYPEVYREVLLNATRLFDVSTAGVAGWILEPTFRVPAALVLVAVALVPLVKSIARSLPEERSSWMGEAFETVLLAAYFVAVPPVLAVGLYFCLWHAPRHIARLSLLDKTSRNGLDRGEVLPAARAFVRDAAPLTAVALVMLAALYVVVPVGPDAGSLLGLYLVLISVLTLPHVAIVSYMDHRQDVWR